MFPLLQLPNQVTDDVALRQTINFFINKEVLEPFQESLNSLGQDVLSKDVMRWLAEAEKNPPSVIKWDAWGRPVDQLITSNAWKKLRAFEVSGGGLMIGADKKLGPYGRVLQFSRYHLWAGSSGGATVQTALSDGASRILYGQLQRPDLDPTLRSILTSAVQRIVSNDPETNWTSGIWMTEITGGSDVSGIQTTGTYVPAIPNGITEADQSGEPLGPWTLNGMKWFTSGIEASMAVVLAKTEKGLTAFYVPTRIEFSDKDGTKAEKLNGLEVVRLKSKLGTRALGTAEIRLNGARGYLLGEEGQGLRLAVESLNIARVYCAIAAVGLWGRGLAISRAFSKVRTVAGGKKLDEVPLFVRGLAKLHVAYKANMLFTFFVIALLGRAEHPNAVAPASAAQNLLPDNPQETLLLLRLFTSILKPTTAKDSIWALQNCMESLGGVGYLENDEMEFNIARLYRDANVLSIWEGTTDVLATDIVKMLKGKSGLVLVPAFSRWVDSSLSGIQKFESERMSLKKALARLQVMILETPLPDMLVEGREIMTNLRNIICGVLLVAFAAANEDDLTSAEVTRRWMVSNFDRTGDCTCSTSFNQALDYDIVYNKI